ncbi:hypothetical protein BC831DRAFT_450990, partial [Entophlyctis helioformis]
MAAHTRCCGTWVSSRLHMHHVAMICIPDSHCIVINAHNLVNSTPGYMAPEMVTLKEHVGPELDIWSMGVVLHELVFGVQPAITPMERSSSHSHGCGQSWRQGSDPQDAHGGPAGTSIHRAGHEPP